MICELECSDPLRELFIIFNQKIYLASEMSQLRSEDMTLLQVMIYNDQGYEIISNLLELEMVHYVDLNKNVMPNKLPFTELLKRAEETSKKI